MVASISQTRKIEENILTHGVQRVYLAEVSNGLADRVVADDEETRRTHFSNSQLSRLLFF